MSRETFVVLGAAAAAMCGCQSSKVKISGRIVGTEPRNIYLEEVTPLRQTIVDSTVLAADGSYLFRLRDVAASPSLYNVVYDNERIPLLVEGGDRVTAPGAVGVPGLAHCDRDRTEGHDAAVPRPAVWTSHAIPMALVGSGDGRH